MIFAEKLVRLRKKSGWSQEELAEQLQVSRQAVSKWEGAQSVPELDKLLQLSGLFGVSVDYLLKDELEEADCGDTAEPCALRRVTLADAQAFLAAAAATARPMALGVLLCVLSPVCLLLLAAYSVRPGASLGENVAGGGGLVILLVMVAVAVTLFIRCGQRTAPFAYLETEPIETAYGVDGLVTEARAAAQRTHDRAVLAGVCLCVVSPLPLFAGLACGVGYFALVALVCLLLALAGLGASLLVYTGVLWGRFDKLQQKGDYTAQKKARAPLDAAVSGAYWCAATALYLGLSFATDSWQTSWWVWAVAGVLYPAVMALLRAIGKPNGER